MKDYKKISRLILIPTAIFFFSVQLAAQDGAVIFKQNCQACHKLGKKLVGPDLLGVTDRRTEEWLISFIKSPGAMVKAGDPVAVAMLEEYNGILMSDQSALGDSEIKAVLAYIKEQTATMAPEVKSEDQKQEIAHTPIEPVVYTEEDVQLGQRLFTGQQRFAHGGPSCMTCHNVNSDGLFHGGLLAKDLTNVYGRMGDAGLTGILGAPPFPAMAVAYKNHSLDSAEIAQLSAFFKFVDTGNQELTSKAGPNILLIGGAGGLVLLLLLIAIHWRQRLKNSVKHNIYQRQIKSI